MDRDLAIRRLGEDQTQASARSLMGLDGNKDEAVQAIKLGEQTGDDPNTIFGDVDRYTKEYKAQLIGQLFKRDPHLTQFVNENRIAATAAQNDWHNLSNFNTKLDAFGFNLIPGAKLIPDIVHGAVTRLDPSGIAPQLADPKINQNVWKGPWGALSYASWYALVGGFTLGAQAISGGIEGLAGGLEETMKSLGADENTAKRASKEVARMAEWGLTGQAGFRGQFMPGRTTTKGAIKEATKLADKEIAERGGPSITVKAGDVVSTGRVDPALLRLNEAIDRAAPYIQAGEDPPYGLHPLWDEALAAKKKGSMEAYDELMEVARKSELRTDAPDYFSKLADTHNKGSMHIDADAVLKLYGEKVPEPGDGILGDVPGIAKAFEDAKKGVDVEVPWSHWLSKVDDGVADGLRDDLKWHPGDVTLREADATPLAKDALGPIEEAKEPPGLPPVAEGFTRLYHGGSDPASGGGRWVTPDYKYARDYREGEPVSYVDIPKDSPHLKKSFDDTGTDQVAPYVSFEAPPEIAAQLRPVDVTLGETAEAAQARIWKEQWEHLENEYNRPKPGDPNFTIAEFNEQWKAFEKEWDRPVGSQATTPTSVHLEKPLERADRLRAEYAERSKTHAEELGKKETLTDTLQQIAGEKITPEGLTRAVRYGLLNTRPDIVTRALEIADRVNLQLAAKLRADIQAMQNRLNAMLSVKSEMAARPMFPVDQRPMEVSLQRPTKPRLMPDALKGEHSFDIIDENGASIGQLEVTPRDGGKDIYINWLGGLIRSHGMARPTEGMLGPRHLKTLLDDLAKEFPNVERLTGEKIIKDGVEEVSVDIRKLREESSKPAWDITDPSKDWRTLEELVQAGEGWERISSDAIIRPVGEMLKGEAELVRDVQEVLNRIAGTNIEFRPAHEARFGPDLGQAEALYITSPLRDPIVSLVLASEDPLGFVRHETVHHLRTHDFYKREEWAVLKDKAIKEWIKKHRIIERYPGLKDKPGSIIEEGVAEGFRHWFHARETDSAVGKIFQKMVDFFTLTKATIKERLGYDLNANEIFTRMETGFMQRRGGDLAFREFIFGEQAAKAARPEAPGFELPPIESAWMPGALTDKAGTARYMRLINKINSKDVKKLYWDAFQEEKKRQTPEWDRAAAEIYAKVHGDISNRADFRTSDFLRNGKLGDATIPPNARKIDPMWLTPEQKAKFPKAFLAKGGNKPDAMAGSFGYRTGLEMIEDIIRFEEAKGGDKPGLYKDKVVAAEVEARMRERFGDLDENIIKAAREHAIGMERFDLQHEEYLKLAIMNKQQMPFTKQNFRDNAARDFVDTPQKKTELINYTRRIGKLARKAEDAWLKGDVVEALRIKQLQVMAEAEAELAKKFEKVRNQWDAGLKRTEAREPSGILPEHVNWIHDIRDRVGAPTRTRDRADIDRNIQKHNLKTLKEFSEKHAAEGLPEGYEGFEVDFDSAIPIWENLKDPNYRIDINNATVGEMTAINNSIQALIKHGREEQTALIGGQRIARNALIDRMVEQIDSIRENKIYEPPGGFKGRQKLKAVGRFMSVGLMQMEYLWDRLDFGKHGLFTKTFGMPFARAGNEYRLLHRDFSRKLTEIGKKYRGDMTEQIPNNIFREPMSKTFREVTEEGLPPNDAEFMNMTRKELRGVMLNVGNASNLDKLARGYGTTPEAVMKWVNDHAKPDDWAFAREVGDVYKQLGDMEDVLNMNLTGVTVNRIPVKDIMMPDGTSIPGWYYPMVYDAGKGGGKAVHIDMDQPPVMRIMTDHGFERPRTNYAGPVSLDTSQIPQHIGRRLRNVAFREIITETKKVMLDERFQKAMSRNMGPEYAKMMETYLRDLAGVRGIMPGAYAQYNAWAEWVRINTVAYLIGWNPGTVMKHTPTAYVQSFKELNNPGHMLTANADLWHAVPSIRRENHKFMMEGARVGDLDWKGSGELQGRLQHWQDTLSGSAEIIDWDLSRLQRARMTAIETGAWMIAKSDLFASKTLWLAKYREVMEEKAGLRIEEAHTHAVDMADRAVRKTHGSTAVTSKPEFMRSPDAVVKTMTSLYQFFNHIANRFWEMGWKSKEIKRKWKAGEPTVDDVRDVFSSFMLYVVFPAVLEEMVTPLFDKEGRSWVDRFARSLSHPVFAAMPIVREVYHAVATGHDPAFGIAASGMKTYTDFSRALRKEDPFSKYNFGNTLGAMVGMVGMSTGMVPAQQAKWTKFAWNYMVAGTEDPRSGGDWYRAFRYGTAKPRRH